MMTEQQYIEYLNTDHTFPMIPYRLDVCTLSPDSSTWQVRSEIAHLLAQEGKTPPTEIPSSPPLVLVSPQYDLFENMTLANTLIKHLGGISAYRFLLWMSHCGHLDAVPIWPANVEIVVRIKQQVEVAAFTYFVQRSEVKPDCSLWIVPTNPITLPKVALNRLLVGIPGDAQNKVYPETPKIRELIASALTHSIPVHLSAGICESFGESIAVSDKVSLDAQNHSSEGRWTGPQASGHLGAEEIERHNNSRRKAMDDENQGGFTPGIRSDDCYPHRR